MHLQEGLYHASYPPAHVSTSKRKSPQAIVFSYACISRRGYASPLRRNPSPRLPPIHPRSPTPTPPKAIIFAAARLLPVACLGRALSRLLSIDTPISTRAFHRRIPIPVQETVFAATASYLFNLKEGPCHTFLIPLPRLPRAHRRISTSTHLWATGFTAARLSLAAYRGKAMPHVLSTGTFPPYAIYRVHPHPCMLFTCTPTSLHAIHGYTHTHISTGN